MSEIAAAVDIVRELNVAARISEPAGGVDWTEGSPWAWSLETDGTAYRIRCFGMPIWYQGDQGDERPTPDGLRGLLGMTLRHVADRATKGAA